MDPNELLRIVNLCCRRRAELLGLQPADLADLRQEVALRMLVAIRRHRPEVMPLRPFVCYFAKLYAKRMASRLTASRRRERQLRDWHLRPVQQPQPLDDADEVAFLMRGLLPVQAEAVRACFFEGITRRELSRRLGRFPQSVRLTLNRAIQQMRHKTAVNNGRLRDEVA